MYYVLDLLFCNYRAGMGMCLVQAHRLLLKILFENNAYVENSKEREMEMRQTNEMQSYSDQHIDLSH